MMHSIIKIGRDTNSVANNLAKKARYAAIPRSMALEKFQWDNFLPHLCVLYLSFE